MDQSLKIQLDIKNNAEDLRSYMLDLKNWEEEMKEKEKKILSEKTDNPELPPPRNKIKRSKSEQEKSLSSSLEQEKRPKRISAYDYSAWDKFDVDKACEEVDTEDVEEEDVTVENKRSVKSEEETVKKEKDLKLIDQAFYEKELGNQFVKKEKWDEAIKCYTRAIEYDDGNPIYYANRGLCFLKLKKFKQAETDSTIAIQLDKKYIKAYQRRALARLALGQLREAKSDYEEILQIEPKNSLSILEKGKIEKKLAQDEESLKAKAKAPSFNPKNIFESKKPEQSKKNMVQSKSEPDFKVISESKNKSLVEKMKKIEGSLGKGDGTLIEEIIEEESEVVEEVVNEKIFKTELTDGCRIILPEKKPPHKRSKKALKRIEVKEASDIGGIVKESQVKVKKTDVEEKIIKEEKIRVEDVDDATLEIPKTCVMFQKAWKFVKNNPERAYSYLKQIYNHDLARIFGDSLESDLFSEIILSLASDKMQEDPDVMYFYLQGLSTVKRFGALVMFMSAKEKDAVKKIISNLEKSKSEKEVKELRRLYEL